MNRLIYLAKLKCIIATIEAESAKRPKLEKRNISNESSGNGSSSATSQAGGDTPLIRKRAYSGTSAISTQWLASQNPLSVQSTTSAAVPSMKSFSGPPGMASLASPTTQSPAILPGFRDTLVSSLPVREGPRDTDNGSFQPQSTLTNIHRSRNRPNDQHSGPFETLTRQTPLLTHDSTVESTSSGASSVGGLYTPRTPLDLDQRAPQFPGLFQPKMAGFFDNHQLPPLRPPSLSPQSSVNNPYQSPQGKSYPISHASPQNKQISIN